MSKKKKTTKSTQTVTPSGFSQPFVSDSAGTLRPAYDKGMAIADSYTPQFDQARGLLSDTLSGRYLNSNPFQEQFIHDTQGEVTDQVNSQFMPRFGSAYHAQALARELARIGNGVRFNQYNTERANQNNAVGQLGSLAGQQTMLPSIPSTTYAENVQRLLGNYVTQDGKTVQKSSGGLLGSLGRLAQIGSFAFAPGG
jgi:hypothetical protein